MTKAQKYLIIIAGPTAVGKTDVAIKIAQQFNTEIISCDSRQFFKELAIGSAQPSEKELAAIKHHFIANLSVTQEYNAGQFARDAEELLNKLFTEHDVMVMTGGSGLYIDAFVYGLNDLPEHAPIIREKLSQQLEFEGIVSLQQQLKSLDKVTYEKIDLNNPQRLMRALEVCLASGKPFSSFIGATTQTRTYEIIKICLDRPREELYERINQRVDKMIESGLLKEAEAMLPYKNLYPLKTVGYKELFDYFENITGLNTAINLIKQHTRNFAKRQLTWFRRGDYWWTSPDNIEGIIKYIKEKCS